MKIIITESQNKSLKSNLKKVIKRYGVNSGVSMVGNFDNFCRVLNIEGPMDFLHLFDDLYVVQSEKESDWTLFRYKPKENFMLYDKKNKEVFIDYDEIWSFLRSNFGLNYQEIQGLTGKWLGEAYNLRGVTTNYVLLWIHGSWMRSTI